MSRLLACTWLLVTSGLLTSAPRLAAEERTAAQVLPATTLLYAEMTNGERVLDFVLEHPLYQQLAATDEYRKAVETKEYLAIKLAVSLVEANLGLTWRKAAEELTAGGVAMGFDATTEGAVLVARSSSETLPRQVLEQVVGLARADAQAKKRPDPIKTADYRGLQAYQLEKFIVVAHEHWLLAGSKGDTLKAVVDRLLDGGENLADSPRFQEARQQKPEDAELWAYVNVGALREAGAAKQVFAGPKSNPLAELLLGGVFANLQQTPYATADLRLQADALRLGLRAPHDPAWNGEIREYFFGPQGEGKAPAWVPTEHTIFSLRTHRDLGTFWLRAGDLFNEKINDDFAKAESQLATLFSGKEFGEDILAAVQPEMQLLVARQQFSDAKVVPAIKLPAFAAVFELKNPDEMQPELRRVFQSLIGFLNVIGAMNGQPQLDLDMEKREDFQVVSANYLPNIAAPADQPTKIHYNFSPSVAFASGHFIVSSTKAFAQELAENVSQAARAADDVNASLNTEAILHGEPLRQVLRDNREQLISQNVLEKGHSREAAAHEIDLFLGLLEVAREARLQLLTKGQALELTLTITTASAEGNP